MEKKGKRGKQDKVVSGWKFVNVEAVKDGLKVMDSRCNKYKISTAKLYDILADYVFVIDKDNEAIDACHWLQDTI